MKDVCFYYLDGYCCCDGICDHDKEDFENCDKYNKAVEQEREDG